MTVETKTGTIKPSSRMTNQRLEIISFLQSTHEHPTAEKIYIEVRKKLPKISLGTIYRNLEVLANKGMVVKLCLGEDKDRYDGDTNSHYHFFCNQCRRIIDIIMPDAEQLKDRVEGQLSSKVESTDILFRGVCDFCQK
jgi:Fur family peroxide stress response transcriptional regulator